MYLQAYLQNSDSDLINFTLKREVSESESQQNDHNLVIYNDLTRLFKYTDSDLLGF